MEGQRSHSTPKRRKGIQAIKESKKNPEQFKFVEPEKIKILSRVNIDVSDSNATSPNLEITNHSEQD